MAEFSQYTGTTSNMDPDWDYDAHEAYKIQEMKKKMNKEEKKEIQGARADLQNLSRVREHNRAINRAMADLRNLQ